jgi:hypothetical protein
VVLGSLAIALEGEGPRRQPHLCHRRQGRDRARYDKIHMFDVDLATGESWREIRAYRRATRR